MVERHPYTVDTGVQFSNEVPDFSGCGEMVSHYVWDVGAKVRFLAP